MPKPKTNKNPFLEKIKKLKRPRDITLTTKPTPNKFNAEKQMILSQSKNSQQALREIGNKSRNIEKNINEKASRVLKVKASSLEISETRIKNITANIERVIKDKTIDKKQKELFLRILQKQLESAKEQYMIERIKKECR